LSLCRISIIIYHRFFYSKKKFIVRENTFSPKYIPDAEIFAENMPFHEGLEFLEIGTGIGVISIMAALKGASKVVSTDISPDAVENTRENILKHQLGERVEVRCGDMYDPIQMDEKFDLIFTNLPILYVDQDMEFSIFERSMCDSGYESYKRYITEGHKYLKLGGRIMLGFSTTYGRYNVIEEIASKAGYELNLVYQEFDERIPELTAYMEIFELKRHV